MAVVGVAGVVLLFVAVLSIAKGFQAALAGAGWPDTAIITRGGSASELSSTLALADTRIIKDAAGVRRADSGPVASAELFVVVDVPKRSTGTVANALLRGVEPAVFGVREEVRLVEGRMFRPGTNEIIVGRMATSQFVGLELGSIQRWGESAWEVVGIFEADGTLSESELWCDARVPQPAYRRGDSFQSVLARLESADVFDRFRTTLTADPRLDVMVEREDAYYQGESELVHALITGLGTIIAALMGIGAVFGAVNTMYSAVAARTREIATLRALGFSGFSVVVSVLVEQEVPDFIASRPRAGSDRPPHRPVRDSVALLQGRRRCQHRCVVGQSFDEDPSSVRLFFVGGPRASASGTARACCRSRGRQFITLQTR